MKVRCVDGEWTVLDEDGVVESKHPSKAAALLSFGYRGRVVRPFIPPRPKRKKK